MGLAASRGVAARGEVSDSRERRTVVARSSARLPASARGAREGTTWRELARDGSGAGGGEDLREEECRAAG
ncbi:hypothetical protein GUJ93_ZPchr0014g46884 [Zizania palustris]|uniref:Uncharacterized protein n=1 Tax=Zizania palustris TaxID=103762 RepID=A0A8J5T8F3_ZIZPA|nr:hypothetical protein GUJ93_ZPchr0014g46884 [Zizania palustris]